MITTMPYPTTLYAEPTATRLLREALNALNEKKTLLYPTETVWGLGCAANDDAAVRRLYAIKERDSHKSMLILVCEGTAELLIDAVGDAKSRLLLRQQLLQQPRATTVVCPAGLGPVEWLTAHQQVSTLLPSEDGSIGIRVPHEGFLQRLLSAAGYPLVSSSANLSGRPSPTSRAKVSTEVLARTDYLLPPSIADEQQLPTPPPSRIVRLTAAGIEILRP
ncbi:MAG: L-threonylcarbamoyladenylate synthase [Bacteroidales bacterium]|nr:L-threonylcarbamoyladenylate synthase [Bacteroidales bacterium]